MIGRKYTNDTTKAAALMVRDVLALVRLSAVDGGPNHSSDSRLREQLESSKLQPLRHYSLIPGNAVHDLGEDHAGEDRA